MLSIIHCAPLCCVILPFVLFHTVESIKVGISIDTGEIQIEATDFSATSSFFLKLVNNFTFRGHIFRHHHNDRLLCASSDRQPSALPPIDNCTKAAIYLFQQDLCICLLASSKKLDLDDHHHHHRIIGHVLPDDVSWDSIHEIKNGQTQIIEAWSITEHGKSPPVERVPCCPSASDLYDKWYRHGLPLILTGMSRSWPAITRWTPSMFRNEFGDVKIHVRNPHDPTASAADNLKVETTMGEYMNFLEDEEAASHAHQHHMVGMLNNFYKSPFRELLKNDVTYFPEYFHEMPETISEEWDHATCPLPWMGPKGTHTPLHHDIRSSFNCQILGIKRWQLVHARQRQLLYLMDDMKNYCRVNSDERPLSMVDLEKFPLFRRATVWNMTNHPGDVLLLPGGLFHDVLCESTTCLSLSLTNFNHALNIKEHRWMSNMVAIGHTIRLAKHLVMGTVKEDSTNHNLFESSSPLHTTNTCPDRLEVHAFRQANLPLLNDRGLERICSKYRWTIVNTAAYAVHLLTAGGEHVMELEGKTAADVPSQFQHLSMLIATLNYGTTVALLSKRQMCSEIPAILVEGSSKQQIGRSLIEPCKMSKKVIAEGYVKKLLASSQDWSEHSELTMTRLSWTGLEVSTLGVFVPSKKDLTPHIDPFHFVVQAFTSFGINHFHIDMKIHAAAATEYQRVLGDQFLRRREEMVLVCHLQSKSKKEMMSVLLRGLHRLGITYCDVIVLEGMEGRKRKTAELALVERGYALHLGHVVESSNCAVSGMKKVVVSIETEQGAASGDLLEAVKMNE